MIDVNLNSNYNSSNTFLIYASFLCYFQNNHKILVSFFKRCSMHDWVDSLCITKSITLSFFNW